MALTDLQRDLCRLIAHNRIASGERLSRDVDLFHDTDEALEATWHADRRLLERSGYGVRVLRDRTTFVEAEVSLAGESVLLQWVRDSAYRFFPLVEHRDFGLTLHPFDLATNKVLALIGRAEPRDWVDVVECHDRLQPLGYLAWAACGKDPGFSPASVLEHASRTTRYSAAEIAQLAFDGAPPDAASLSRRWHEMLRGASEIIARLPAEHAGRCVLDHSGRLCRAPASELQALLAAGSLIFHAGRIRGVLPRTGDAR